MNEKLEKALADVLLSGAGPDPRSRIRDLFAQLETEHKLMYQDLELMYDSLLAERDARVPRDKVREMLIEVQGELYKRGIVFTDEHAKIADQLLAELDGGRHE